MPTSDGTTRGRAPAVRPARLLLGTFGSLALAACAAACASSPGYMAGTAGPAANAEATLGWWLTGTSAVVVLIVAVVLFVAVVRGRSGEERERPSARRALAVDSSGGTAASGQKAADATQGGLAARHGGDKGIPWIYWGSAVTLVILVAAFVGTAVTLRAASRPPSTPAFTIDVTGHQWWWEAQYHDSLPEHAFYTANELHIPVGRPVRIRLRTADVIHSFWVPQLARKIDMVPGRQNRILLSASRPGVYRGQCAEFCGFQHANMALEVVAQPATAYRAWLANMARPAPAPASAVAQAGKQLFMTSQCASCHMIRGTPAQGLVGPDLTHLATRSMLAAATIPNNPSSLAHWIRYPQSVKPGSRMPDLGLSSSAVGSIVTYLKGLR